MKSACNTDKSAQHEKPILVGKLEKISKKPPVKSTSPVTSAASMDVNQLLGDAETTIPLRDSQAKATSPPDARKMPITSPTLPTGTSEQSTASNTTDDNEEIVKIDGIDIPPNDNQTSSDFDIEEIKIGDIKSPTQVPNLFKSIAKTVTSESEARVNTKFIWDPKV